MPYGCPTHLSHYLEAVGQWDAGAQGRVPIVSLALRLGVSHRPTAGGGGTPLVGQAKSLETKEKMPSVPLSHSFGAFERVGRSGDRGAWQFRSVFKVLGRDVCHCFVTWQERGRHDFGCKLVDARLGRGHPVDELEGFTGGPARRPSPSPRAIARAEMSMSASNARRAMSPLARQDPDHGRVVMSTDPAALRVRDATGVRVDPEANVVPLPADALATRLVDN